MHRTFKITIEGVSPLIQDNPAESDLAQLAGPAKKKTASKQEQGEAWRKKVYNIDGTLCHPARAFETMVKDAAKNFKGRGRASMKESIRQTCWVEGSWLAITNRKEPDEVMVSTPQTLSGRVPSYLPVFKAGWRMEFMYQVTDDEIVTPAHLHEIISWGGQRIGMGKAAYRPKFGRFIIVGFEEVDALAAKAA
jgi:hypothetical protein